MKNRAILIGLLLVLILIRPVRAAEVLWTDDFASQWQWTEVRNAALDDPHYTCVSPSGRPQWQVVNGAVEINIDGSIPCATEIVPLTNAVADQRFQRVSLRLFISNRNMDRNLLIRWQDSANRLGIHLFGTGIQAEKMIKGQSYVWQNGTRAFNFQENHWYNVFWEYDLSARNLQLWLDDQLVLDIFESPSDPQLEQGKPGLAASVGAVSHSYVRFDDFRVESLAQTKNLEVLLLKQTDDPWRSQIYDTATLWAPQSPLIKYWGCALVSAVMVLRYYGIDALPDETTLDPGSLNLWLQQEVDGYLPDGSVNWRALSRLSYLFSQSHTEVPTLEMTYANPTNQLAWLRQQIQNNQPVILAEPGHFITAYGFGPGRLDFNIHDPFYTRLRLDSYANTFTSARLFVPSHTDLSGITVITPLSTQVVFQDTTGNQLTPVRLVETTLATKTPYFLYDLAKPPAKVELIFSDTQAFSPIWLAAYTATGKVSVISYLISSETTPLSWNVDLTADQPQITTSNTSMSLLSRPQLIELYLSDRLRHPALVDLLLEYQDKLLNTAILADAQSVQRGFELMLNQSVSGGWLTNWLAMGLRQHFRQILLTKFP